MQNLYFRHAGSIFAQRELNKMADEVRAFLENNLPQHVNKFMELGYDDLKQLLDMPPEEITNVMKEVALYDKPGHQKRFVSAMEILSSKTKHGAPDSDTASQCTIIMPNVSHDVRTCKSTCFIKYVLSGGYY